MPEKKRPHLFETCVKPRQPENHSDIANLVLIHQALQGLQGLQGLRGLRGLQGPPPTAVTPVPQTRTEKPELALVACPANLCLAAFVQSNWCRGALEALFLVLR